MTVARGQKPAGTGKLHSHWEQQRRSERGAGRAAQRWIIRIDPAERRHQQEHEADERPIPIPPSYA